MNWTPQLTVVLVTLLLVPGVAAAGATDGGNDTVQIADEEVTIGDATITVSDTTVSAPGLPNTHIQDRTVTVDTTIHIDSTDVTVDGTTYVISDVTVHVTDVSIQIQDVTLSDGT